MPADQTDHEARVAALTARIAEAFDMPVDLLNMDHWHALEAAQRREFAAQLRATADELVRPVAPTVDGPPCLRCGGDLADHILTAGPNGGDDEYRCLRDELSDVLHDMETSEPADDGDRVDPRWVEIVQAVAVAYERSLVSVEGPIWTAENIAQAGTETEAMLRDGSTLRVMADTAHIFATLRDIADAEPLVVILGAARCTMCGARDPEPNGGGHPAHPHPHLVSCPWARTVQIVGVKTDA